MNIKLLLAIFAIYISVLEVHPSTTGIDSSTTISTTTISIPKTTTTTATTESSTSTSDSITDMLCGEPPLPRKNSERIISVDTENVQFFPGEIVMYRCKDHFYFNEEKDNVQNISCTKVSFGSKWKPKLTRCRPIKCPEIEKTEGLSFIYNDQSRKFDTIATFSCEPNHVLEGHHALQCLKTGKWSGPYPVCKYCVDIRRNCPVWKAYCDSDHVIANCKRTCGLCLEVQVSTTAIDSSTTISTATIGMPTTTTTTTTANTESSTSYTESITDCVDIRSNCPVWKAHCDNDYVIANCKRTCGLCLEVQPSTTEIDSSTTTIGMPTTTTPTTTTANTESSTSTSESITDCVDVRSNCPVWKAHCDNDYVIANCKRTCGLCLENNQKMDLMIMLPASMEHSDSNINSMKYWLKNVAHGLSTFFDLQILVVQYFEVWYTVNRKWNSGTLKIMKVPYRTQEQFDIKVDQMKLKYDSRHIHFDFLSSSAIEKSRNIMLTDSRHNAIKSMITLFQSFPGYPGSLYMLSRLPDISKESACSRHLDINTFIVGIGEKKSDIQKMASGLLSDAGVFMETSLNQLESTVAPLIRELKKLSIPVNSLSGCSDGNIPLLHDGCYWSDLFKTFYSTGEEINAHCNLIFDDSYTECRSDGKWSSLKQRCSGPSSRSARSIDEEIVNKLTHMQ